MKKKKIIFEIMAIILIAIFCINQRKIENFSYLFLRKIL